MWMVSDWSFPSYTLIAKIPVDWTGLVIDIVRSVLISDPENVAPPIFLFLVERAMEDGAGD